MVSKIRIYLDNCVYNRPFDNQTQIKVALESDAKRHIQRLIIEGKIELAYSFVNRFENSKSPYPHNQNTIAAFLTNATKYVDHNYGFVVRRRAEEIIETGVKTKDAYHIACAIVSESNYLISTDRRLLKYQTQEIIICDPIRFLDYLEGEQQ